MRKQILGVFIASLLTGGYIYAGAENQSRLTYQFDALHYIGLLNLAYDFRGTEEVTISKSGNNILIEQAVTGKVRWPTTPGGFTAIPYSKWIEYLDSDGNVQRHIDVLQDDMVTDFSFRNTVTVQGTTVTDVGGDRVSEARIFINISPLEGFLFWSWLNPLWPDQDYPLVIGKHNAGEIVSGWVPKWVAPARTYVDETPYSLKVGSDTVVGGKSLPTLTGQVVYVASHPSKPGSGYQFMAYELTLTKTLYWDRGSGLLLRQELRGVSNNPVDTSQLSLTHNLVKVSGMSLEEQIQTTTQAATTFKPMVTTTAQTIVPATLVQNVPKESWPIPPLLLVAIIALAVVVAAIVFTRQRNAPSRRPRRKK